MTTHFAAVKDGLVVATRSSTSRSTDCPVGHKFGPYTHAVLRTERETRLVSGAVTETTDVISWHGGAANAAKGLHAAHVGRSWSQTWSTDAADHASYAYLAAEVVPVVVTAKKAKLGQPLVAETPCTTAVVNHDRRAGTCTRCGRSFADCYSATSCDANLKASAR